MVTCASVMTLVHMAPASCHHVVGGARMHDRKTIIRSTYTSGKPIGYQMRSSPEGFSDN
jgi:hypothetical protein